MIIQLRRLLENHEPPRAAPPAGVAIRRFRDERDISGWLALRRAAFDDQQPPARDWSESDFRRELMERWWWRPEWTWLAEKSSTGEIVGAVTLALRGPRPNPKPAIHWLMVHPDWRRRGVAKALVQNLEAAAWSAGYREVCLETHSGWTEANRFYQLLGYG